MSIFIYAYLCIFKTYLSGTPQLEEEMMEEIYRSMFHEIAKGLRCETIIRGTWNRMRRG